MHVMQEQIDACSAILIFRVYGWSFKSFSLIKSWVQNRVSTMYCLDEMMCMCRCMLGHVMPRCMLGYESMP